MRRSYNPSQYIGHYPQPQYRQPFHSMAASNPIATYAAQNAGPKYINYAYKTVSDSTSPLPQKTTSTPSQMGTAQHHPVTVSNKFKNYFSQPRQIMYQGKPYMIKFVPTQMPTTKTTIRNTPAPTIGTTLSVPQSKNPYPFEIRTHDPTQDKSIDYKSGTTIYVKRPKNTNGSVITPEIYSSIMSALNKKGENKRRVVYLVMDNKKVPVTVGDSETQSSNNYANYNNNNLPQGYIEYPTQVSSAGGEYAQSRPKAPFTPSPFLGLTHSQPQSIRDILTTESSSYGHSPTQDTYGPTPGSSYGPTQSTYGTKKPNIVLDIAKEKEKRIHNILNLYTSAVEGKTQRHKAVVETLINPLQHGNKGWGQQDNEAIRKLIQSVKSALTRLKAKKALTIGKGLDVKSNLLNTIAKPLENNKVQGEGYGPSAGSSNSAFGGITSLVQSLIPGTSGGGNYAAPIPTYGASGASSYSNQPLKPLTDLFSSFGASTQKPSLLETFNEALYGIKETKKNILEAVEKITDSYKNPFSPPKDSHSAWSFSNTLKGGYSADSSNVKEQYANLGETLFSSVSNILTAFKAPFDMMNQYGSS